MFGVVMQCRRGWGTELSCPSRCGIFDQIWIVTSVCYHPLPLIPIDSFVVGQKHLARGVGVSVGSESINGVSMTD